MSIDGPRKKQKTSPAAGSPDNPDSPAEVEEPLTLATTTENVVPPDVSAPAEESIPGPSNKPFTQTEEEPVSLASECPVQSEATTSKLPLYCLCKEEPQKSPDSDFIGCSKQHFCLSKLERLATLKRPGGDWFHYYCVGLDSIPSKISKWFCPMCKAKMKQTQPTTKTLLSRELGKHDLKLMNFSIFKGEDNTRVILPWFPIFGSRSMEG